MMKWKIFIISLVIITLVFTILFFVLKVDDRRAEERYILEVNAPNPGYYSIMAPVPETVKNLEEKKDISSLIRIREGTGNVTVLVIDGKPWIKVDSSDSIKLEIYTKESYFWGDFSWCHNSNNTMKIYSEKPGGVGDYNINISFSQKSIDSYRKYSASGTLTGNWQWIPMEGTTD